MSRPWAPGRLARRVARSPWARIGLHVVVLLGLLATSGVAVFADRYFNRGVASGAELEPIPYTDVNPLGVNTFLNEEADPAKVERTLDMIAEAGFTYVRQMFPWYEIEPAQDTYFRDGVSTWAKYDRIVDLAVERHLEIIARLDKPPRWARAGQPNLETFPDGPPNDYADYADFVATFVNRYRGKIRYIQIWNEPNLQGEWGGLPIDPAAFTELLKAAYTAAKQADPGIVVLMPGLAPTDQRGPENLSDLLFLQGMYDAGAKDYFDIGTTMVYGYGYSPYDRRVEFARNNFSRPIQLREIMERNGDGDKPMWAAEYGWVSLPDDWAGEPSPWGEPVSADKQAEYLYQGYLRAQREWPWMGVMCVWYFRWTHPPDAPDQVANPTRGFAMVEYDFTPRPAWRLLSRAASVLDRAFTGAYTVDSRLVYRDENWNLRADSGVAQLVPLQPGAELAIPFSGPRIDLVVSGPGEGFTVTVDGEPAARLPRNDAGETIVATTGAQRERITVADGLDDGPHVLEVRARSLGAESQALEGFVVVRRPLSARIYPWIYAALALAFVLNLGSLGWALAERRPMLAPVPGRRVLRASQLRAARREAARRR